ncbi:MAG: glycosyltransferase family 4 protein [Prevotella sp.]|jgi:glycosyltransferase involved in cell wall biosynthesis|nr:glycosyltransferase family 4 protein [Prevotella sp.]
MNILFIHLLNNYTGSPMVLANILKELSLRKEFNISLLTSKTHGCLSGIHNVQYYDNHYKWSNNKVLLLLIFLFSQIYLFFFILFKTSKIDIIYINTIHPFAAALAACFMKKKILYHVHEVYIHPNILQSIMWFVMEKTAWRIISVSQYVRKNIKRDSIVIYNTVSREFEYEAGRIAIIDIINHKFKSKNIVMISSLKKYKGIGIFISLAKRCPEYSFLLIMSSTQDEINQHFLYIPLPQNIQLIPVQKDLLPYYFDASIIVNLSLPDLWIETFGMTLIEGFCLGTPSIAPDFGGPKEIVINGENGFLVNPYDEDAVVKAFNTILSSESQYRQFVENVLRLKNRFSIDILINSLINEINSLYLNK